MITVAIAVLWCCSAVVIVRGISRSQQLRDQRWREIDRAYDRGFWDGIADGLVAGEPRDAEDDAP